MKSNIGDMQEIDANMRSGFGSRRTYRRAILLCAIVLSGGALYLPRPVLLLLFFVLVSTVFFGQLPPLRKSHFRIYLWITLTACLAFTRPAAHEIAATVIKLATFFTGLVLLNLYRAEPRTLAEDLSRLIHPMCYQAIGTVLIKLIAPGIFYTLVVDGATTKTVLLIFNYHDLTNEDPLFARPNGFFWEPGVFQIYLNIFVYVSLFINKNIRSALLGSTAVLTTQSTTGILILGIQLAVFAFKSINLKSRRKLLRGSLVALVIAPTFIYVAHENISEKLFGQAKGSAVTREFDLLTGLLITQANPLKGIGFSKENYIAAAAAYGFAGSEFGADYFSERQSTSNGLVQALFSIGIPLGSVLIIGLLRQSFFPNNHLVFTILTLSLIGEALMFTPIFLALSFSGLAGRTVSNEPRSPKLRVAAPT